MGYYIDKLPDGRRLPAIGKATFLERFANAQRTDSSFKENLVCVVDNGPFEAAGYAFNEDEFNEFARPDGRKKIWLTVPDAAMLSGFWKLPKAEQRVAIAKDVIKQINSGLIEFGRIYEPENERLIAIMKNIIKNKGEFKP